MRQERTRPSCLAGLFGCVRQREPAPHPRTAKALEPSPATARQQAGDVKTAVSTIVIPHNTSPSARSVDCQDSVLPSAACHNDAGDAHGATRREVVDVVGSPAGASEAPAAGDISSETALMHRRQQHRTREQAYAYVLAAAAASPPEPEQSLLTLSPVASPRMRTNSGGSSQRDLRRSISVEQAERDLAAACREAVTRQRLYGHRPTWAGSPTAGPAGYFAAAAARGRRSSVGTPVGYASAGCLVALEVASSGGGRPEPTPLTAGGAPPLGSLATPFGDSAARVAALQAMMLQPQLSPARAAGVGGHLRTAKSCSPQIFNRHISASGSGDIGLLGPHPVASPEGSVYGGGPSSPYPPYQQRGGSVLLLVEAGGAASPLAATAADSVGPPFQGACPSVERGTLGEAASCLFSNRQLAPLATAAAATAASGAPPKRGAGVMPPWARPALVLCTSVSADSAAAAMAAGIASPDAAAGIVASPSCQWLNSPVSVGYAASLASATIGSDAQAVPASNSALHDCASATRTSRLSSEGGMGTATRGSNSSALEWFGGGAIALAAAPRVHGDVASGASALSAWPESSAAPDGVWIDKSRPREECLSGSVPGHRSSTSRHAGAPGQWPQPSACRQGSAPGSLKPSLSAPQLPLSLQKLPLHPPPLTQLQQRSVQLQHTPANTQPLHSKRRASISLPGDSADPGVPRRPTLSKIRSAFLAWRKPPTTTPKNDRQSSRKTLPANAELSLPSLVSKLSPGVATPWHAELACLMQSSPVACGTGTGTSPNSGTQLPFFGSSRLLRTGSVPSAPVGMGPLVPVPQPACVERRSVAGDAPPWSAPWTPPAPPAWV